MNLQIFVFTWPGQYHNACATEQQLRSWGYAVTVVNSDPDNWHSHWINLRGSAYFTEQWLTACKMFHGDVMFHIQADATYADWNKVIADAMAYRKKYNWGIYCPDAHAGWATPMDFVMPDANLKPIANSDCTCWFIDGSLIQWFNSLAFDWSFHKLGWGIDCILCAESWRRKRWVLRDLAHNINHPASRGYSSEQANSEFQELLSKMPAELAPIIHKQFNNPLGLLS